MIRTNIDWHSKTEVKKGDLGEQIILDFLHLKGFVIYKPITKAAHLIDYFGLGKNKKLYCFEVKTKRRMAKYDKTGFELRHWQEYLHLTARHNVDIFFFFVDDFEECIYGAWLSKLKQSFAHIGSQVVFPLSLMTKIEELPSEIIETLTSHTTENYNYDYTKKFFQVGFPGAPNE